MSLAPSAVTGARTWAVVVDARFLAVVPPREDALLRDLSARIGRSPSIEELVSLVPLAVEAFAVVVALPESSDITAVVRGNLAVDVHAAGGSRVFSDQGIRPWLLADFRAVDAFAVRSASAPPVPRADAGAGAGVPSGVVLADRVDARLRPADAPWPSSQPDGAIADPDTVLVPDRTAIRTPDTDSDEDAPDAPAPPPAFTFAVDGGEEHPLDGVWLLGRDPRPPRVAPGGDLHLLAVDSPSRSVSATHLELRREGGTVVATDLRSTNGTTVRTPEGVVSRIRPGQSRVVLPGASLRMGDDTIVTVSAAAAPAAAGGHAPTMREPES